MDLWISSFNATPQNPSHPLTVVVTNHIDYALISLDLVDAVKACGYKPFQQLFGNATPQLGPAFLCDFTAKCPTNNSKHITAQHAHLVEQGFFQHLACLQSLPDGNHELAKRLDTNLQEASESASNKVKPFQKSWWSLAITKARAIVDILCRQLLGSGQILTYVKY
jgi:hypothetical protein